MTPSEKSVWAAAFAAAYVKGDKNQPVDAYIATATAECAVLDFRKWAYQSGMAKEMMISDDTAPSDVEAALVGYLDELDPRAAEKIRWQIEARIGRKLRGAP